MIETDIVVICSLCGKEANHEYDLVTELACGRCGRVPYHQECVDSFMRSQKIHPCRQTGFSCPRGFGKDTRDPCRGKINSTHAQVPRKKKVPLPAQPVVAPPQKRALKLLPPASAEPKPKNPAAAKPPLAPAPAAATARAAVRAGAVPGGGGTLVSQKHLKDIADEIKKQMGLPSAGKAPAAPAPGERAAGRMGSLLHAGKGRPATAAIPGAEFIEPKVMKRAAKPVYNIAATLAAAAPPPRPFDLYEQGGGFPTLGGGGGGEAVAHHGGVGTGLGGFGGRCINDLARYNAMLGLAAGDDEGDVDLDDGVGQVFQKVPSWGNVDVGALATVDEACDGGDFACISGVDPDPPGFGTDSFLGLDFNGITDEQLAIAIQLGVEAAGLHPMYEPYVQRVREALSASDDATEHQAPQTPEQQEQAEWAAVEAAVAEADRAEAEKAEAANLMPRGVQGQEPDRSGTRAAAPVPQPVIYSYASAPVAAMPITPTPAPVQVAAWTAAAPLRNMSPINMFQAPSPSPLFVQPSTMVLPAFMAGASKTVELHAAAAPTARSAVSNVPEDDEVDIDDLLALCLA